MCLEIPERSFKTDIRSPVKGMAEKDGIGMMQKGDTPTVSFPKFSAKRCVDNHHLLSQVGSPRHMQQNYQDAMAMVRKFGNPDLFLTFTCNPSWSENLNSMEGVQRPEDQLDIIVRVFNMKLKELLEDICKHGIFGTILAYIYVIEFKKRGFPHAHILLTLDSESKIRTKDDIDKFVSAELPDPCTDLRLFQIATKCMVHGPCGTINIKSPCMRDGQCCKSFPKQFKDDT
ncbi:hypothetical protein AVEN_138096-1 [Araneus ventricosus]|uniref:Helitron helicase-like domain-containing protein n=1 Tax=Araneus ventricosus TaxID=182803 RepID=A0A4Y2QII3_ARAVE|nr:hypothetical protein AVEN_138096-1 [Araneus ventricosus]